jgi:hypothetical protein
MHREKNNDKSLAFESFIDGSMVPFDCSKVCDGGYLLKGGDAYESKCSLFRKEKPFVCS